VDSNVESIFVYKVTRGVFMGHIILYHMFTGEC